MTRPLGKCRLLREFIAYYRPHAGLFYLDMSSAVIQAVLTVLIPLVVYEIFERYVKTQNLTGIVVSLGVLLVLIVVICGAEYVSLKWGHVLGVRMEADMRRDLFGHLQKLSFSYFDRTKTGHIMSRISNDLTQITEAAHHGPEDLLISSLTMIGAFIAMFSLNTTMALVTVVPLPFIILWGSIFQKRMHDGFRELRERVAQINSRVENSIQGIREVKSFTNEANEVERFREVNHNYRQARSSVFHVLAWFHSGISFLIQSYSILFVGVGAMLMYWGKADLPEVLAFVMYSRFIIMPIFRMVNFAEQYQQGITAFERFREVMNEAPEIVDAPDAETLSEVKGDVRAVGLSFQYPGYDELVLKEINLHIPAGKTVALVGESGAGKTTLAALIPRFYDIASGSLTIDGHEVRKLKQRDLRSQIGLVQQSAFLFDASIRENILFGRADATEAEVIAAAREANIWEFIESLPEGLDTEVGEHGVRLSGGQRQRISLARVFVKNPAILIFDEATSALDNHSEALIQDALARLCQNRTTLIIAHRLSTVRHADMIYCLRHGEVVESGTHAELLAKKGYYSELYAMHSF